MNRLRPTKLWLAGIVLAAVFLILLVWQRDAAFHYASELFYILSDPQRTQSFIQGFQRITSACFYA